MNRHGDTVTDERAIAKWISARQRVRCCLHPDQFHTLIQCVASQYPIASPSDGSQPPPPSASAHRSASRRTSRGGLTPASG